MRHGSALAIPLALAAAISTAPIPASAEPPPAPAPLGPRAQPAPAVAPAPILEHRSAVAVSCGAAAAAIGGILIVGAAVSGGVQATCDSGCHHTSTVIGLAAAGSALIAIGIPLIVWGVKLVPVPGPAPAVALVPSKPLPAWLGASASGAWALRF